LAAPSGSRDNGQISDAHHHLEIRADDMKVGRPMIIRVHPDRYRAKPLQRRHNDEFTWSAHFALQDAGEGQ
jgi:hypothetical protein